MREKDGARSWQDKGRSFIAAMNSCATQNQVQHRVLPVAVRWMPSAKSSARGEFPYALAARWKV